MAPFRYRRLAYIVLQVTDLARSTAFYRDLVGLTLDRVEAGRAYLRCSDLPQNLILLEGPTPGIARVAMELESAADLDQAFVYLQAEGFAPQLVDDAEARRLCVARALRFREPASGLLFEFHIGPDERPAYVPTHTHIQRLGHVVLNVRDFPAVEAALVGKLNFPVSDHVPGKVAFLRAFPNPYHHSFAILKGPENGFHHVNFMVSVIDDVGRAMNRVKNAGVPIVYGPGHHLPSGSIFLYFLDPDGMTAEYSFGMEKFPEIDPRIPRELEPKPEVMDTWGSLPDPRMGSGGLILGPEALVDA